MGENSKIAWTDHTWNCWQGCHKVSAGCKNCYMYRDKKRYGQDADKIIRSATATFNKPLKWKDPAKVFVCSWSDFFISEADEWRDEAYNIMEQTPHLTYLILTKRPENIWNRWRYLNNIWLGVTIESQSEVDRLHLLRAERACIRFLSIEPLLSRISLDNLEGIHWVIIGAESGSDRRECSLEWVWDIIRQCDDFNIPVFVKQLHINGKVSQNIEEWPEDLRRQEFPIPAPLKEYK
jgi:protein gp37